MQTPPPPVSEYSRTNSIKNAYFLPPRLSLSSAAAATTILHSYTTLLLLLLPLLLPQAAAEDDGKQNKHARLIA